MNHSRDDIRVDIDALLQFAVTVQDTVVERLRPQAAAAVQVVEAGAGAIGNGPAFDEAVRVRHVGESTTAAARQFLDLLGGHVAALGEDARSAGESYRTLDGDLAERTNVEREDLWRRAIAEPGMPGHVFAARRDRQVPTD